MKEKAHRDIIGSYRNAAERERDKAIIVKLYLTGKHSQAELGPILQKKTGSDYCLSQTQIYLDLKDIRKKWLESALVDFDKKKALELAKLDNLEVEYWEAWEKSKRAKRTIKIISGPEAKNKDRTEVDDDGNLIQKTKKKLFFKSKEVTSRKSDGDSKFLEGVRWCIDRRIKLLGLDPPQRIAPTDPSGTKEYQGKGLIQTKINILTSIIGGDQNKIEDAVIVEEEKEDK